MSQTTRLERALGYEFRQPGLLRQALTHRSHSSPHNERLEFLGDSVLDCVISTLLYERFAQLKEGELSRMRASLVRQESLAAIGLRLGIGEVLRLGEGELKSGGFRRPSILADSLEALFGAIYLDGGYEAARRVIGDLYREQVETIDPKEPGKDAKTALQEWLQARRYSLPIYALLATHGEAHEQAFEVTCTVPAFDLVVTGAGGSRRAAEQQAAQSALERLQDD